MMKIGFTGTQKGMSATQIKYLEVTLGMLETFGAGAVGEDYVLEEFHHGDCIGADSQAHKLIHKRSKVTQIIIHPPDNPSKRAYCSPGKVLSEKSYLDRNKDIVDATSILIACPLTEEIRKSGTWATVRYARKRQHAIIIIYQNGNVNFEKGSIIGDMSEKYNKLFR